MEPEASSTTGEQRLVPQIRVLLEAGDARQLAELIESRPISDALRGLLRLDPDERDRMLALLPPEIAAELIDEAPSETAADLVERLESVRAADIIEELRP